MFPIWWCVFEFEYLTGHFSKIGMLEYLAAPCPYIIGMHRSLFSDEISLSGVLVVDLDYGYVRYHPEDSVTHIHEASHDVTEAKRPSV